MTSAESTTTGLTGTDAVTGLPGPTRQRWQPLRAGLVDLFYYDVEEFHFHGGSLLLRGNNGTGKSKVLALTLPFLLDGELAPHRVEPDGDRNKRMEWNLLLGGRYPHPERLGYTWLEFGRRDSAGDLHYLTIGCGLKAVAGRGIARHWFFVTDQRVGEELALLTPARTAVNRDRLKEAIGLRGMVYDRAGDYRRAVDEALFGLGSRYDALVSLLIQLRQPQLSKRPDERLLSAALTEALPPLDENLVMQVAEAFRSLDDERDALLGLTEARRAAEDFLGTYGRYARIAAKRKAAGPRQQHSRYEHLGRDLADAQREYAEADAQVAEAERRLAGLDEEETRLRAQQRALEESPEARAADNLRRLAETAAQLAGLAAKQRAHLDRLTDRLGDAERRVASASREADAAGAAERAARDSVDRGADDARLADRNRREVLAALAVEEPPYRNARRASDAAVEWRASSLRNLDRHLAAAGEADRRVERARAESDRLEAALADADERIVRAEEAVTDAGAALVTGAGDYLAALVELHVPDPDGVLSALELWVETLDGVNPAARAVADAAGVALSAYGRAGAQLDAVRRETEQRLADVERELQRLADGGHEPPAAPHTRDPQVRAGRPGAPLWRVVDFAEHVAAADRAGLEAALETAGILDAWVEPDGTLRDPLTGDTLVRPGPAIETSLAGPLRPAIDTDDPQAAALDADAVRSVLRAIGVGPQSGATTWVDTDGRYAAGVLTGRWHKPAASHIGEGAREAARRARVARLETERAQLRSTLDDLRRRRGELDAGRQRLADEQAACPPDLALRDAHTVARTARQARRELADEHARAGQRTEQAIAAAARAHREAGEFAADVGLPTSSDELAEVRDGVQSYRVALAALWPAAANAVAARARCVDAEQQRDELADQVQPAADESAEAQRQALAARQRHDTLNETVGADVAQLQRRLADVAEALAGCGRSRRHWQAADGAAREARGTAHGQQARLADELTAVEHERDLAVRALRAFTATGLLRLACPELELPDPARDWAATPAVQLARTIDRMLSDVDGDDRRWERSQQAVTADFKLLADGLSRHGHTATLTVRDDAMIVDVTFQGHVRPVADLADALAREVEERQRVLSAHEREVLENHLVNEVAGALQELISAAESQVATMNDELASRPTSTGMRLRLQWRPAKDAPAGLAQLRARQLRQSTDVWNAEDRRAVGAFLQEQIQRERMRDDAGTWAEQLTRALDYRSWHAFSIERHQDGQWRPAAGPASGGERVLAASVPLFAAASSYYSSAGNPYAPRLIALDEAFAGVDDDSRAKCLGLLATFDLDVVMTSEREWGCYPQVPGLAIAQLARRDGIDAVLVTPWRWDGRHRQRAARPVPHIPAQATGDEPQEGLLG